MFKNDKGFTLIEMLFVLMIISVLLILIIPSFSSKSEGIHEKGCNALVSIVQAQADVYQLDHSKVPASIDTLKENDYISNNQTSCPNGGNLTINNKGIVSVVKSGE